MTLTLAEAVDRFGMDVLGHLDRQASIPILSGMQRQGDVLVVPRKGPDARTAVPKAGVPVVRGEAGGHTHRLLADGPVFCDVREASARDLTLAVLTVPQGSVAYLGHEEHAYSGIGPGRYVLKRQREMADELRMVSD